VIRAAGGVVVGRGESGAEVLIVHRPAHGDWSLPKGKCEAGESDEDCALREVEEETGLRCALDFELASTHYHDAQGRPKTVRYWAMRPLAGVAAPATEVDELRWLPLPEAREVLTWDEDRRVLDALAQRLS
jgi:8-oxo-dGTP pyrophosphatase MutT (NUDIX family)